MGAWVAVCTRATLSGVPASVVISQAAPTPWTVVPVALTRLASHKARNRPSRSGERIPPLRPASRLPVVAMPPP